MRKRVDNFFMGARRRPRTTNAPQRHPLDAAVERVLQALRDSQRGMPAAVETLPKDDPDVTAAHDLLTRICGDDEAAWLTAPPAARPLVLAMVRAKLVIDRKLLAARAYERDALLAQREALALAQQRVVYADDELRALRAGVDARLAALEAEPAPALRHLWIASRDTDLTLVEIAQRMWHIDARSASELLRRAESWYSVTRTRERKRMKAQMADWLRDARNALH